MGTWTKKLYKFFEERNKDQDREMIQVLMPKEQTNCNMLELQEAARAWTSGSCDGVESLDDVHPMAVTEAERADRLVSLNVQNTAKHTTMLCYIHHPNGTSALKIVNFVV